MKEFSFTKLKENIEGICAYDFQNRKGFGAGYAVCHNGTLWEGCYGTMSLKGNLPVNNRTLFRLASMTKPITAVATLILVEQGVLSLDDSIDKFLPEFREIKIDDGNGTLSTPKCLPTVRHLLTHTSGIGSLSHKLAKMTKSDRESLSSAIAFYIKSGLDFEPGEKQIYSGTGAFDVLTKIIEIVTGRDYLSFLKKTIFTPCEMPDTTFLPSEEQMGRLVAMHQRADGENVEETMADNCIFEQVPMTHFLGGAGLVSTLHDYCHFAELLLSEGTFRGRVLLKKETFRQMSVPQVSKEIMSWHERWGLGVRVIDDDAYPHLPKGAFGWSGAYGSHFWIDPQNQLYAVFMKNSRVDGGSANESARKFEEAVYASFV